MNNTLKYVKLLEESGISRQQAEAHVQLFTEVMEDDMATKQDIKNLEVEMRSSVDRLEHKILQVEFRIMTRLGFLMVSTTSLAVAVLTWLIKT